MSAEDLELLEALEDAADLWLKANLDEGAMWSTAVARTELTATVEARIAALMKKADGLEIDRTRW